MKIEFNFLKKIRGKKINCVLLDYVSLRLSPKIVGETTRENKESTREMKTGITRKYTKTFNKVRKREKEIVGHDLFL